MILGEGGILREPFLTAELQRFSFFLFGGNTMWRKMKESACVCVCVCE